MAMNYAQQLPAFKQQVALEHQKADALTSIALSLKKLESLLEEQTELLRKLGAKQT